MVRNRDQGERRRILAVGVAMVAALLFFNARYPSPLRLAELKVFDLRMYAREPRQPRGDVAIVAIDDKSIVRLGRWPWPRTILARLTDALKDYHVAVIGYDMVFSERDYVEPQPEGATAAHKPLGLGANMPSAPGASNDQTFANSLKAHGNIVVGYPLQVDSGGGEVSPGFVTKVGDPPPLTYTFVQGDDQAPPSSLTEAVAYLPNLPVIERAVRGAAFFNAPSDSDAVFRSEMLVIRFGKLYCEPFILAIASAYAGQASTRLKLSDLGVERVSIGSLNLPVDEQGRMVVNFRGPAHTFPYYSASDVIARRVAPQALANKIVLVGASAFGVGDRLSTPMGADFPGVEIHANAIDNILTGDFIERSGTTARLEWVAALIMGLLVTAAVAYLSVSWSAVALVAMIFGYVALAQYLLVGDGLLVGVLFPIATVFITYAALTSYRLYLTEEREKRLLAHAVGDR
jgi:adenylate cyclase